MSSDDKMDDNFRRALDFLSPKVDLWMKEMFKGFDALNLTKPQKEMFQGLTVETMLYNTLMTNDEILAVLGGIIKNIATKHSYRGALSWGKREELFRNYSAHK